MMRMRGNEACDLYSGKTDLLFIHAHLTNVARFAPYCRIVELYEAFGRHIMGTDMTTLYMQMVMTSS
jgi:hypothetical protein